MTQRQEASVRRYRSPAREWDVFISHASEDKPYIRQVVERLISAGLTVFLDEHQLVAGRSLRGQIEHALINSRLGVLFVSHSFLEKRWPREEYDALFTLEDDGQTRILPIWLGVTVHEVRDFSPILASRVALLAKFDPLSTADEIVKHIEKIYNEEGSWAQLIRVDTLCLPWVQRPLFMPASLKALDEHFPTFWNPSRAETEIPTFHEAPSLRVGELVMQAPRYDGKCVIVIGRQEKLQLYDQRLELRAEYVFQLLTRDPAHQSSIVYVRYVDVPPDGSKLPAAPVKHLSVVIGFIIASGAVTLSDNSIANCAYIVAAKVHHVPELQ
ncbi:MAG TPA: toll/interleukin-1 receptor domain-containing protein [Caulobacteraceae bacterium]|jgi:hypothetical protein|nr:toll/interleukin-1 receptor domain-containing protein [Caulobacteraceae bacterium]